MTTSEQSMFGMLNIVIDRKTGKRLLNQALYIKSLSYSSKKCMSISYYSVGSLYKASFVV